MGSCFKNIVLAMFTIADENECDYQNGHCVQVCENTEGSYECQCLAGFVLAENGFNCLGR